MTATQSVLPGGNPEKKVLVIKNLVTLKIVLFTFFGGLGCLFPFLPIHMLGVGLSRDEAAQITTVAAFVSILGPLCAGPIADALAARKGATGKHLRIMAAIAMILGAILYGLLLLVPYYETFLEKRPLVGFGCDMDGGILFQERIEEQRTCYYWEEAKVGKFMLTNCSYTCQKPTNFEKLYKPWAGSPYPPTETSTEVDEPEYSEDNYSHHDESAEKLIKHTAQDTIAIPRVPPPHICKESENGKPQICHAFTENSQFITLEATLRGAINNENETHSAEWCKYPLDGFKCNIPPLQVAYMHEVRNSTECEPMIECEIFDPYNSPGSILGVTLMIGDPDTTFWMYLLIRSLADIFPVATIALLNAAIIVATRETSTGRGDVGHQLVWAAIGWAVCAPIVGAVGPHPTAYMIPIVVFIVMSVFGAIIILFASDMPLSPPEWWWHTKSGMVAIPMSAARKYAPEAAAVTLVAFLLGLAWSAMDTYKGWFIKDLIHDWYDSNLLLTLTLTVGALTAVPFLWYAERIVDYCGHSNLLISSFIFYVLRFTVMSCLKKAWVLLVMEVFEPLTLTLTFVTIILYMRHLIPRRITATGQALPIVAHFCLGKTIGSLAGATENYYDVKIMMFRHTYMVMADFCLIIAVLYFILYHGICRPRCGAKPQPPPKDVLQGVRQNGSSNPNANGSYTPLRVYHNGRARKGQFRY